MESHDTIDQVDEQQKNLNSLPQWAQDLIRDLVARIQELEAQIAVKRQLSLPVKNLELKSFA